MNNISSLVEAWVSTRQRHFCNSTRGIATVEQRLAWEAEAEQIIADHEAELRADERRRVAEEVRDLRQQFHDDAKTAFGRIGSSTEAYLNALDDVLALLEGGGE